MHRQKDPTAGGQERKTRSGRIFSAWKDAEIIQLPKDFDYEALIQASFATAEADALHDDSEGEDVVESTPHSDYQARAQQDNIHEDASTGLKQAQSSTPPPSAASEPAGSATQSPANQRRAKRRRKAKATHGLLPTSTAPSYVESAASIAVSIDSSDLLAERGAYGAKTAPISNARKAYTKEQLVKDLGFTSISWDGKKPMVGVDAKNRACLAFVGQPARDPTYADACRTAHQFMEENAGLFGRVPPHTRGHFPALNVGLAHGKGTKHPLNMDNKEHTALANELLGRNDIQRLASFASSSFTAFAPELHSYYQSHLNCLFEEMPQLKRIFTPSISIFPTAAFNFGPDVWTYKHRDVLNCPFGWCSIQALGRFDPTKGGHIVLWEPRLVVEFPPGALILIPSATITHSNIPVAPGDVRTSFTQYAPGGLFRYVDDGFRLRKEIKEEDPELYAAIMEGQSDKWKMGLDLLRKVKSIPK